VISNAGIAGLTAAAEEIGLADWARVLEVNLTGAFLITRAAIPDLLASGGYPRRTPYAASK